MKKKKQNGDEELMDFLNDMLAELGLIQPIRLFSVQLIRRHPANWPISSVG